jgi:hypothetical protein
MDSLSAFEKLIEAYGKIADMMPRLDRLEKALHDDHNFQNVLALVYSDIVEFHRRAYKFVRRKCMFSQHCIAAILMRSSVGHLLRLYVGRFYLSIRHNSEEFGIS